MSAQELYATESALIDLKKIYLFIVRESYSFHRTDYSHVIQKIVSHGVQIQQCQGRIVYDDSKRHSYAADAMTLFQLRPPELLFVDNPITYHQLFSYYRKREYRINGERVSATEYFVKEDIGESGWVHAVNRQVQVRACAIRELLECCMASDLSIADDVGGAIVKRLIQNNCDPPERAR